MSKFKVGDLVKIVKYRDISIYESGKTEKVGLVGKIDKIRTWGAPYSIKGEEDYFWYENELELAEKTLDNLEVGDELLTSDEDDTVTVLAVSGKMIAISYTDSDDFWQWTTANELKRNNYKLKSTQSEPKEMTVEEVSKALGHEVKIVKDK